MPRKTDYRDESYELLQYQLEQLKKENEMLWKAVQENAAAQKHIDGLTADLDKRLELLDQREALLAEHQSRWINQHAEEHAEFDREEKHRKLIMKRSAMRIWVAIIMGASAVTGGLLKFLSELVK